MQEISVSLKNQLAELERLSQILHDLSEQYHWHPQVLFDVNLALEEVVTNIVSYGYDDSLEHHIELRFSGTEDELIVEVEDDGRSFNPLERAEPDIHKPLEERPIGGLGIFLVRKVMDNVAYRRDGGKNVLILKKKLVISDRNT